MKRRPARQSRNQLSVRKKLIFACIAFLVSACVIYPGSLLVRSRSLYKYAKSNARGWSGTVHQADTTLGLVPIPDSRGEHVFPIGPNVPMRYDEDGFRVPIDEQRESNRKHPVVLALGCSFTYADACLAEDAYVYKTAKALNGTAINAGVCSYGLAQMMLRAEDVIERVKPDIVLVQYSSWLVDRSITPFAPTFFSRLPVPYFADDGDGAVKVIAPAFAANGLNVSLDEYRDTPPSMGEQTSFFFSVSLPLMIRDDFSIGWYTAKKVLGFVPSPTQRREAVVEHAFREIQRLCRDNGAQMIVVVVGNTIQPTEIPSAITALDVPIADAHAKLIEGLSTRTQDAFLKAYAHYRGDPPQMVDGHPNPHAHDIIADAVVEKVRGAETHQTPQQQAAESPSHSGG